MKLRSRLPSRNDVKHDVHVVCGVPYSVLAINQGTIILIRFDKSFSIPRHLSLAGQLLEVLLRSVERPSC